MERIKKFFAERDRFAKYCGMEIIDASSGGSRVRMPIREHHLNGMNTVHGGAIFSLADFAFALACNSHGIVSVAVNTSITFVKAAVKGTLTAVAEENSVNPKLGSYTVRITDDAGDLVAIFQGLAYRKKETLDDVLKK